MHINNKLTATTISLPFYYDNGKLVMNEPLAESLVKDAYSQGIRSFTTSPQYIGGTCECFLGRVLEPVRKFINLSTNYPYFDKTLPVENAFEFCLSRSLMDLRTEYLDCLYLYADSVEEGLLPQQLMQAKMAKEEGRVHHIGIIFTPLNLFSAKEVLKGTNNIIDTVMIYFIPTLEAQKELLSELKNSGITIVGGGLVDAGNKQLPNNILSKSHVIKNITASELATRYFMSQSVFDEVIFQLESKDFLDIVCEVSRNSKKYDYTEIEKYFKQTEFNPANPRVICCNCGYCSPCPKGIEINKIFNSYAYYNQYGMSNIALEVFKEYQDKVGGSIEKACINCGLCEKKCSHSTPIRKNLRAVEKFMNDLNITSKNFENYN
ncbi:aldo/keto reductase [Clostridium lacusfryxellense]|uniref:aldo/keto reductase n=1 Tax=Clostridium lacusfryxellense TaxID=205328 RepID=UPI001C0B78C1|nr:aldo/keto reductase [Clostridium lacusfryxellense]MBU3113554.1 aldo/keto reductase [Clostridium lacusfryxellense]